MDIIQIINNLTSFIQYFAVGFLFFGTYTFSACLQREEQSEYFIVKSVTVSFIINAIVIYIFEKFNINHKYFQLVLILVAGILGLILGCVRQNIYFRMIIEKVFRRTVSDNIFTLMWESAKEGKCVCLRFRLKDDMNYYEGQVDKISSIYQDPIILLRYYVIKDENGKEKENFSECNCAYMIVKWSQIEKIEMALGE